MEIPNEFHYRGCSPDMSSAIRYSGLKLAGDLNCLRIATVEEFHPEDMTVTVRLLNKKTLGQNQDGTPNVTDFSPIRAKICFCNPFITCPIQKGDDCLLLFSDREIESWFINGDAQPVNYTRMHDLTDAFAIFGIRSIPNMIMMLADCLNLFYGNSNIALSENVLNINSPTVQISNLQAMNGDTGTFVSQDNKVVTVESGIITSIVGNS